MKRIILPTPAVLKTILLFLSAGCALPLSSRGDLFVGYSVFSDTGEFLGGFVSEYSNSGMAINPTLISGLGGVRDIAVSGNTLYVLTIAPGTNGAAYTVGAYTTSGHPINRSLISGVAPALKTVTSLALSRNNIFLGSTVNNGTVAKYTTAGTLVNASLVTSLGGAVEDLAISGGNLFVGVDHTVGEYTLSGTPVNPALITFDDGNATALAVSGSTIFVRNSTNFEDEGVDTIGKYTITGEVVDPLLITGLTSPNSIAIAGNELFVSEIFMSGEGRIGSYNLSGEPIDRDLIRGLEIPFVAAGGPTNNVPESLSVWWLGATLAGMLAAAQLRTKAG